MPGWEPPRSEKQRLGTERVSGGGGISILGFRFSSFEFRFSSFPGRSHRVIG